MEDRIIDKPAFPVEGVKGSGMSLRDYFAGQVLQGILAAGGTIDIAGDYPFEARAKTCYMIADAMLKERVR